MARESLQVNPWINQLKAFESPEVQAVEPDVPTTGPDMPQNGIPAPDKIDQLPTRTQVGSSLVWCLGAHGGAGESTLAELNGQWRAAGHAWPQSADGTPLKVVLVARTSGRGLRAAQKAATQWASGLAPATDLLGLVLVADAPGRLPKPLRELSQLLSGGVPRVWTLPWVEEWRLGGPVDSTTAPQHVKQLVDQIETLRTNGASNAARTKANK